jgi:hypothetical protein
MDTIIGHLFSCRFYGSAGIKPTFMHHPKELYNILFKSSWATLKQFGTNKNHLGVEPVMKKMICLKQQEYCIDSLYSPFLS